MTHVMGKAENITAIASIVILASRIVHGLAYIAGVGLVRSRILLIYKCAWHDRLEAPYLRRFLCNATRATSACGHIRDLYLYGGRVFSRQDSIRISKSTAILGIKSDSYLRCIGSG